MKTDCYNEGPPKICFLKRCFCHDTTSLFLFFSKYSNFYFALNISNNLISNFIYLIIYENINFVNFLCIILVQMTWKKAFHSIIKWIVKNIVGESSNNSSSNLRLKDELHVQVSLKLKKCLYLWMLNLKVWYLFYVFGYKNLSKYFSVSERNKNYR